MTEAARFSTSLRSKQKVQPDQVVDDGTRRYYLHGKGVDVNALDPMLDKIDPDWREHITNWRGKQLRRSGFLTRWAWKTAG